jgi:hypothetical protein
MTLESTKNTAPAPARNDYVAANGVRYYYEVRGQGEPLLPLHGGLGSIEMFGPVLTKLSATRQGIAVGLHGHGRTQLGHRTISLVDRGDDMATIVEALRARRCDGLLAGRRRRVSIRPSSIQRAFAASSSPPQASPKADSTPRFCRANGIPAVSAN